MAEALKDAYASKQNIISQINVDGVKYDIVDEAAKTVITTKLGTAAEANVSTSGVAAGETGLVTGGQVASAISNIAGAMHFVAGSRTTITDPKAGDVCIEGNKEYLYTGSEWIELGDESLWVPNTRTIAGLPLDDDITDGELISALGLGGQVDPSNLGAFAFADKGKATIAAQTITGVTATGTPSGTINVGLSQTSTSASLTSSDYTPAGTVTVVPSTTTIKPVSSVGSMPELNMEVEDGCLNITLSGGATPTLGEDVEIVNGITSASFDGEKVDNALVTAVSYDKASIDTTTTTFTGSATTFNVGNITVPSQDITVSVQAKS